EDPEPHDKPKSLQESDWLETKEDERDDHCGTARRYALTRPRHSILHALSRQPASHPLLPIPGDDENRVVRANPYHDGQQNHRTRDVHLRNVSRDDEDDHLGEADCDRDGAERDEGRYD